MIIEAQFEHSRGIADVFLHHDVPLLSVFLALGLFGAWLGSRDRYIDRWLGYGLILVAALGIGCSAERWL